MSAPVGISSCTPIPEPPRQRNLFPLNDGSRFRRPVPLPSSLRRSCTGRAEDKNGRRVYSGASLQAPVQPRRRGPSPTRETKSTHATAIHRLSVGIRTDPGFAPGAPEPDDPELRPLDRACLKITDGSQAIVDREADGSALARVLAVPARR